MNDVNTTAPAADTAAPAKAKAKKVTKAKKTAAAKGRATNVSAAAAKTKTAKAKAQARADKAISNGRKPKEKAEAGPRLLEGNALNSRVKFGTGKDGKRYSLDNSPKRAGTGAAKVWKKYGGATMTLEGLMANGMPRTFVLHDLRHGYIELAK